MVKRAFCWKFWRNPGEKTMPYRSKNLKTCVKWFNFFYYLTWINFLVLSTPTTLNFQILSNFEGKEHKQSTYRPSLYKLQYSVTFSKKINLEYIIKKRKLIFFKHLTALSQKYWICQNISFEKANLWHPTTWKFKILDSQFRIIKSTLMVNLNIKFLNKN